MKRLLPALAPFLLLLCTGTARADSAVQFSVNQRVVVSTVTAGTTLLSADQYAKRTCLMNSTTDYLLIGDADTTFSTSATTGTFRLPGTTASTNPQWYCFDGPTAPYKGALKAVSGGATSITVDVIRER
jgi:hypothetical protein